MAKFKYIKKVLTTARKSSNKYMRYYYRASRKTAARISRGGGFARLRR